MTTDNEPLQIAVRLYRGIITFDNNHFTLKLMLKLN